jgi:hypothetical protein
MTCKASILKARILGLKPQARALVALVHDATCDVCGDPISWPDAESAVHKALLAAYANGRAAGLAEAAGLIQALKEYHAPFTEELEDEDGAKRDGPERCGADGESWPCVIAQHLAALEAARGTEAHNVNGV